MRAACRASPGAGIPWLPAGFGACQVPEQSITARASIARTPQQVSTCSTKGAASRPDPSYRRPKSRRATPTTFEPVRMRPRSVAVAASGAR